LLACIFFQEMTTRELSTPDDAWRANWSSWRPSGARAAISAS
jgi:hypothetical protein